MNNPKVLFIGHFGFTNLGCEAIVRSTVDIIRKALPDARLTLISRIANHDREVCEKDGILLQEVIPHGGQYPRFSSYWWVQALARRVLKPNLSNYDYTHSPLYRSQDLVLSIGGDNLSDDYGIAGNCFNSLCRAKRLGAKTVIWAASIGPFRNVGDEKKWTRIMQTADLITVRESLTREYLLGLGVNANVRLVADPAFVMKPVKPCNRIESYSRKRPLIGISFSDGMRRSRLYGHQYENAFIDFVNYLISEVGAVVRLIPHVNDSQPTTDDIGACRDLAAKIAGRESVEVVNDGFTSPEMKFLIGECDFFIGSRTHSTIASLSQCIPTLSVGFSVKAYGINQDLFGTKEYVIGIEEISSQRLRDGFQLLQLKREQIVAQLQARIPQIQAMAMRGGEFLARLVN